MNRGRFTAIAAIFTPVAVGLAFGLATMSGATASARDSATSAHVMTRTATTTAVTAGTTPKVVALGCDLTGEVMPAQYVLACADGNAGLSGLHWTSWETYLASGYGSYYMNDCKPSCASGHYHDYPALVTLWGSGTVAGHPSERRYTHVTVIFEGRRPPFYQFVNDQDVTTYPLTQTWPLWP